MDEKRAMRKLRRKAPVLVALAVILLSLAIGGCLPFLKHDAMEGRVRGVRGLPIFICAAETADFY